MKKLLLMALSLSTISFASVATFDINNLTMNYKSAMGTVDTGSSSITINGTTQKFEDESLVIRKGLDHLVVDSNLVVIPLHYGFFKPVDMMALSISSAILNQSEFSIVSNSLAFATSAGVTTVPSFNVISNISSYTTTGELLDEIFNSLDITVPEVNTQMTGSTRVEKMSNVSLNSTNGNFTFSADMDSWINYSISIEGNVINDKNIKVIRLNLTKTQFGILSGAMILSEAIESLNSTHITMHKNVITIRY